MSVTSTTSNPLGQAAAQALQGLNPLNNVPKLTSLTNFVDALPDQLVDDEQGKKISQMLNQGQAKIDSMVSKGNGFIQGLLNGLMKLLEPLLKMIRGWFDKNAEAIDSTLDTVLTTAKTTSFAKFEQAVHITGFADILSSITEESKKSLYLFNVKFADDPKKAVAAAFSDHQKVYEQAYNAFKDSNGENLTLGQLDKLAAATASRASGLPPEASKEGFDLSTINPASITSGTARFYLDVQAGAKAGSGMPTEIKLDTAALEQDIKTITGATPATSNQAAAKAAADQQKKPTGVSLAEKAAAAHAPRTSSPAPART